MTSTQRDALLETGLAVFHRQGFGATGVREVAAAAGIPPGSFTNHFRSKDAFGLEVLDRYVERLDAAMRETLGNRALLPRDRLFAYFDRIAALLEGAQWQQGCFVVDLAAEIPGRSEALRRCLLEILEHQSASFDEACRAIDSGCGIDDLGSFIVAAWHGTLIRMKVERNASAIGRFRRTLEQLLP